MTFLLISFSAVAAVKGHLPVEETTIILMGAVDSSENPAFLKVNPATGALIVEDSLSGIIPVLTSADFGISAAKNIKSAAGNVYSLTSYNYNGSIRFLLLHDKALAPGGGDVPKVVFIIPSGAQIVIGDDFFNGVNGMNFINGIGYCFSTTARVCTPGANADQDTVIVYK